MRGYSLPPTLDKEIDDLESLIKKYKNGEISSAELKARRVPFGVYEQRERDTYMMRIRCAAGYVSPYQLGRIAELSSRYATGSIHVTTRQELQIHNVRFDAIIPLMRELKGVGLAARGGGGNTVRNIIIQEDAGVSLDEVFDVTPHAIALTSRLIAENDSWTLPRKYKIAFSGSSDDRGHATIADLGFIATVKEGEKGFKVYVAGGLGAKPAPAKLLFDFIAEDQVYYIAKALKMLFWKHGNRKNKHAARLRFLWSNIGEKEFKRRFTQEYNALKAQNIAPFVIEAIENKAGKPSFAPQAIEDENDFSLWVKRFVRDQRQKELASVVVPVELGFIDSSQAKALSKFLEEFGDNVLRLTKDQNFLLRNIARPYLANVYSFLKKQFNNFNRPFIYDKLISCAGASTCQLGICLSRGAAGAVMKMFDESDIDFDALSNLKINISGCPNACGQHHVADIGFCGKAARKEGRMYPAYRVVVGGLVRDGKTELATEIGEASARDVPRLLKEFLSAYVRNIAKCKDFKEYINNGGLDTFQKICQGYKEVPSFEENKNYYFDWTSDEIFSLTTRGAGECSAGLFDLIDVDAENIRKTKEKLSLLKATERHAKELKLLNLVFYAARMLLITRGIEPKEAKEVYDSFYEHFVKTGLVSRDFENIIRAARDKNYMILLENEPDAYALAERVRFLYDNMDNAFQFKVVGFSSPTSTHQSVHPVANEKTKEDLTKSAVIKDFRGVACPMNFVKTKMELSKIQSKELLQIWLDEGEPIENVPGSVREEGHEIIEQRKMDNYWAVTIRKK